MDKKTYNEKLDILQKRIGYKFKDRSLLLRALTHSSYIHAKEMSRIECYERMEFFGDAILEMIVSEQLFLNAKEEEGEMTIKRSQVVKGATLAKVSREYGLPELMRRQEGVEGLSDPLSDNLSADLVEALIAGIYIEAGYNTAKKVILNMLGDEIENALLEMSPTGIFKTRLQEKLQENGPTDIKYVVTDESGPAHNKTFWIDVIVDGEKMGSGVGNSKKEAEQEAAQEALELVEKREDQARQKAAARSKDKLAAKSQVKNSGKGSDAKAVAGKELAGKELAAKESPAKALATKPATDKVKSLDGKESFDLSAAKNKLQEKLQENGKADIKYLLAKQEGPDHDKTFWIDVLVNGKNMGRGKAKTKKQAEKLAAKEALDKIQSSDKKKKSSKSK